MEDSVISWFILTFSAFWGMIKLIKKGIEDYDRNKEDGINYWK